MPTPLNLKSVNKSVRRRSLYLYVCPCWRIHGYCKKWILFLPDDEDGDSSSGTVKAIHTISVFKEYTDWWRASFDRYCCQFFLHLHIELTHHFPLLTKHYYDCYHWPVKLLFHHRTISTPHIASPLHISASFVILPVALFHFICSLIDLSSSFHRYGWRKVNDSYHYVLCICRCCRNFGWWQTVVLFPFLSSSPAYSH